jgi:hypothetical protein
MKERTQQSYVSVCLEPCGVLDRRGVLNRSGVPNRSGLSDIQCPL